MEGMIFEFMALSPSGFNAWGSFEPGQFEPAWDIQVEVEGAEGLILLHGGGGSFSRFGDSYAESFSLNWRAETPIDVSTVTAVVINGHRILVS